MLMKDLWHNSNFYGLRFLEITNKTITETVIVAYRQHVKQLVKILRSEIFCFERLSPCNSFYRIGVSFQVAVDKYKNSWSPLISLLEFWVEPEVA